MINRNSTRTRKPIFDVVKKTRSLSQYLPISTFCNSNTTRSPSLFISLKNLPTCPETLKKTSHFNTNFQKSLITSRKLESCSKQLFQSHQQTDIRSTASIFPIAQLEMNRNEDICDISQIDEIMEEESIGQVNQNLDMQQLYENRINCLLELTNSTVDILVLIEKSEFCIYEEIKVNKECRMSVSFYLSGKITQLHKSNLIKGSINDYYKNSFAICRDERIDCCQQPLDNKKYLFYITNFNNNNKKIFTQLKIQFKTNVLLFNNPLTLSQLNSFVFLNTTLLLANSITDIIIYQLDVNQPSNYLIQSLKMQINGTITEYNGKIRIAI